nr:actin [Colletotrichum truncatum]KAF6789121.1 actin [Colletotrichum truncatum]
MEKIWKHAFSELGASPSSHPIIMTEPAVEAPKSQRLHQATYVFETLHAPAYYTTSPAILSAYAANLPTTLVVDSGYTGTYVVTVHDFKQLRDCVWCYDVAGQAVEDWLVRALSVEEGVVFSSNGSGRDYARLQKFERARVAADFQDEYVQWTLNASDEEKKWELPDGRTFSPGRPLGLLAGELLFDHSITGFDVPEFQYGVVSTVMKANEGLRGMLWGNILLAGGNTMIPGYGERLEKEARRNVQEGTKVNVIAPRDRMYSAWIGGSMVSELSTFRNMCISRAEYDETGPGIVDRKCS